MKYLYSMALLISVIGCANCILNSDQPPNIREQPGIEYCDDMCKLFKDKDCKPYYEDITLQDGGTMTCVQFCEYELKNSVPLNPKCIVETMKECSEIENICK